jgi:phosphoglucosamine mutase
MAARAREIGADIGIALDGDADRVIVADEHGEVVDGDPATVVPVAGFFRGVRARSRTRGR